MMQILLYSLFCFIFLKEESKTILACDPTNPGSARAVDKTHKIIQVECVSVGVPDT